MVTHLNIILGHDCSTSVIWPFTLNAFTFESCLCKCQPLQGWVSSELDFFLERDNRLPNLNASIRAQHKHETKMRAARVNGQNNEVKQGG